MLRSLILAGYVCVCSARFSSLKMRISAFYLNWNLASLISPSAMRNVNVCLSRSGNVWTSATPPPLPSLPRNTYITNRAFYLLCSAPPGYCCRWFWSGTLAFDIVCLISGDKCSFRQNVDSGWFHWIQKNEEQNGKEWKTKNKEQQQQPTIQRFNCFLNVYSDIIHYKRWYEQVLWTWRMKKKTATTTTTGSCMLMERTTYDWHQ